MRRIGRIGLWRSRAVYDSSPCFLTVVARPAPPPPPTARSPTPTPDHAGQRHRGPITCTARAGLHTSTRLPSSVSSIATTFDRLRNTQNRMAEPTNPVSPEKIIEEVPGKWKAAKESGELLFFDSTERIIPGDFPVSVMSSTSQPSDNARQASCFAEAGCSSCSQLW